MVTLFSVMHSEWVSLYLQNITLLRNSTHFKTLNSAYLFPKLTFKACWSELYLAIGLPTPLLLGKKLNFELYKHGTHFSLIIILLKSTLPYWIEWVLLHSLSAYCDEIFVKQFWKSTISCWKMFCWLTLSSFAAEYCAMTNECWRHYPKRKAS